jgi:SanA protein
MVCALAAMAMAAGINFYMIIASRTKVARSTAQAPNAQVAIVLGARVFENGVLSDVVADRVDTAIELYRLGKVKKLLLTGDHGQTTYDEVNAMRRYVLSNGIPSQDIFLDHAGFSTFDSMYRARDVFKVKDALVVTQRFHLARSVYTANSLGVNATGIPADRHIYAKAMIFDIREALARIKAFSQIHITRAKPKFLGPKIPITGDGRKTNDRPE